MLGRNIEKEQSLMGVAWPRYRDVPLLKKRGQVLASAGLVFITLVGIYGNNGGGGDDAFPAPPPAVDRRVPGGVSIDLAGPQIQGQQDHDLEADPEKAIVVRCWRVFVHVAEPDHTRDPGRYLSRWCCGWWSLSSTMWTGPSGTWWHWSLESYCLKSC